MTIHIGMVGAGSIALQRTQQLKAYHDIQITAIAEPVRPIRDKYARLHNIKLAVTDYHRIINDPSVDVIWICSPTITHSSVAIDALNAGKHVICEQPMAMNILQADEMVDAAGRFDKRLYVTLPFRYDPVYQEVRRLIETDEIGYPYLTLCSVVNDEYDRLNDWHDWKGTWDIGGGGVLIEHGSEIVDMLHFILGKVDAVNAVCTRFAIEALNKAEDSCLLGIEFFEEATAELAITGAAKYLIRSVDKTGTGTRVEIFGSEGSILVTSTEPELTVVSKREKIHQISASSIKTAQPTDMINDILNSIMENKEPFVTPKDAREALRVVLAGYKSSQMKRRVEIMEQL